METFFATLLADESQKFFLLGISAVVILTITLIIVASVSRVRFFKHLFHEVKEISREKEKEIEQLRREKQAMKTKNKIIEDKLLLFDETKRELNTQKSLISTIQERASSIEESQKNENRVAEEKSREFQDLQYKYRGLQKRNEILVEENSIFRTENKSIQLQTTELETIVLEKFIDESSDLNPADIEKMALDILDKNKNFFESISDQTLYGDISPLLEDILQHQRELTREYEKRISKDMDLEYAIVSNIELHRRVELEESIRYDSFSESQNLALLTQEIVKNIIKIAQVGSRHIKQLEDESYRLNITLPYDGSIVVDAGVSLESYDLYLTAEKRPDQDRQLKSFLQIYDSYVNELIENSSDQDSRFVVMFIPNRGAIDLLLKHKSQLYDKAYKSGVILTSSTQLLTLLQSISRLWGYYYNIKRVDILQLSTQNLEDNLLRVTTQISTVAHNLEMIQESFTSLENNKKERI